MRKMFLTVFFLVLIFLDMAGMASGGEMVSGDYQPGMFPLVRSGKAADIFHDSSDHKVVAIAAEDLSQDIERVTGIKPLVKNSPDRLSSHTVIIGTIERCGLVKDLIKKRRLDAGCIQGQWESFIMATVDDPVPGVGSALVIAGSDRRGAAFGAYELSRQIGVSPWCWWADSAPDKKQELFFKKGFYRFGPPSVRYRGIFINDEDFGIQPWAAQTFDPELGDIGPKSYARVFELLLRLKANHLWPAMHNCTRAFNYYPENRVVADDYAIVMGSAHCEQMLRNNVDEWRRDGKGPWIYQLNRKNILRYWEDRLRENGNYENVYTLGMRALHDTPIHAIGTTRTIVNLYERIIADQRDLLKKWVNQDVTEVPQVFCPYNEVQYFYRHGLELPEDVTIMWADDNHGYIRTLSSPQEQKRPGGSGVYYHVSYLGPPHDYLWLCSTGPGLIWEEMQKAWEYNARKVWVLNVGDIKPAEIATEFFLQMAWDIDRWNRNNHQEYLEWFAEREFGKEHGKEIAEILADFYTLNFQRRPEHMGFNFFPERHVPVNDPEFSLWNYGDEVQKRIDAFDEIEKRSDLVYESLPDCRKDAFYQMVLYQVRCASMMNKKILYAYKSRVYARQGRWAANLCADKAREAFEGIRRETEYYNTGLAGGKWNNMMSWHPHDMKVFEMPKTGTVKPGGLGLGVAIEGQERPLSPGDGLSGLLYADRSVCNTKPSSGGNIHITKFSKLPIFNRFTRRRYFIDVFNRGEEPVTWQANPSDPWISLDVEGGELKGQERIQVDVDYEGAPAGEELTGSISISGGNDEYVVGVEVFNPDDLDVAPGAFVQDNGVISINAEGFARAQDKAGRAWRVIDGLGRTGAATGLFPVTMPSIPDDEITGKSPLLTYPIHVFKGGEAEIYIQAIPTHEIHQGRELILAVSLDEAAPKVVRFKQGSQMSSPAWWGNVLRAYMLAETSMQIPPGSHQVKVWGLDPSVVIDRIIIDFGGLKKSCLGPPETRAYIY